MEVARVREIMGVSGTIFPGPSPISIERKHMRHLNNADYVVSPKADGERFLLSVKDNRSVLINRLMNEFSIEFRYRMDARMGTILDVEMVKDRRGNTLMLVFDCYEAHGKSLRDSPLGERLLAAENIVKGILKTKRDKVKIDMKPVFSLKSLAFAVNNDFGYVTDGLIFTPKHEPARCGTHNTLFKWKPLHLNTVDFLITPRQSMDEYGYDLGVQEKGSIFKAGWLPLRLVDPSWRIHLDHGGIFECKYVQGDQGNFWYPIIHRVDKQKPNGKYTYQRTLVNIDEDIQWKEFEQL